MTNSKLLQFKTRKTAEKLKEIRDEYTQELIEKSHYASSETLPNMEEQERRMT